MHCPACKTHLRIIAAADLELDQCPDCHGIWFDKDELKPFLDFALRYRDDVQDADYDPKRLWNSVVGDGEPTYRCPVCDVEMAKFNYAVDSNVILDRCPECEGLWVERPEIPDLASFVKGNPARDRLAAARAGMVGLHTAFLDQMRDTRDFNASGPYGKHRTRFYRKKW